MSRPQVRAPAPTGAIVLLLAGGLIGLLYVGYVAVLSVAALGLCLGPASCTGPVAAALSLYWALLALAIVTGGFAVALGWRLRSTSKGHRLGGAIVAGLAIATLTVLGALLRGALVYLLLLFGGWCLILVLLGGILAILWTPTLAPTGPSGAGGAPGR